MNDLDVAKVDCVLSPPSLDEVEEASIRLTGQIVATPLVENHDLNRMAGGRLLIKAEMLQRTGSFKFRGAYNRICQLSDDERRGGVVANSSGNDAQAVACAAGLMGTRATIVMPTDAPDMKVERTRKYGAEIVMYDRTREKREDVACRLGEDRGLGDRPDRPVALEHQKKNPQAAGIAHQMKHLGQIGDPVLGLGRHGPTGFGHRTQLLAAARLIPRASPRCCAPRTSRQGIVRFNK